MSLTTLMVDDVEILRAPTSTDRYGNVWRDWDSPSVAVRESKGWMAQQSAAEVPTAGPTSQGREGESSDWILYLPAGDPIAAVDRVRWEGDLFTVVGKPNPAKTPRGAHHIETKLNLMVG